MWVDGWLSKRYVYDIEIKHSIQCLNLFHSPSRYINSLCSNKDMTIAQPMACIEMLCSVDLTCFYFFFFCFLHNYHHYHLRIFHSFTPRFVHLHYSLCSAIMTLPFITFQCDDVLKGSTAIKYCFFPFFFVVAVNLIGTPAVAHTSYFVLYTFYVCLNMNPC